MNVTYYVALQTENIKPDFIAMKKIQILFRE